MNKGKVNDHIKGNKMKKQIKLILSLVFILTSASFAEKKFVPLVMDDLLSFASYYTTNNNLQIPILDSANEYRDLVVQCENDITYFIMAHRYYDTSLVTASRGSVVIDENTTITNSAGEDTAYLKGYIEGNESISITGRVYYENKLYSEIIRTCNRSTVSSENRLQVPTFNGNSQGKLVTQCEDNVVYYIMAYDCLRQDTNPSVTTDNGIAVTDEKRHVGEVFYVKGHVTRTGDPVTITGHVYSGGKDLYIWPDWIQTCP